MAVADGSSVDGLPAATIIEEPGTQAFLPSTTANGKSVSAVEEERILEDQKDLKKAASIERPAPGEQNESMKDLVKKLRVGCFPDLRTPLRISALFLIAFLLGLNDAGWGVILPFFRDHYGLNNATASLNFVLGVCGFILSSLSNGVLLPHFGMDSGIISGTLLQILGFGLLSGALPFGVALFAFFVNGFASGLLDAGSNILSVRFPIVGNLVLNYFHAIYGIGALVGPPIATAFVANNIAWNFVYFVWIGFSAFNFVLIFIGFRVLGKRGDEDVVLGRQKPEALDETVELQDTGLTLDRPEDGSIPTKLQTTGDPNKTAVSRAETTKAAASNFKQALRIPLIWISAFFLLFYVGAEVIVGSWAFSFLTVVRGGTTAESGPFVSIYWGGLVVSRLFFMPLTAKLGDLWAGVAYTIISTIGLVVIWSVPNISVNAAMLFFVGLGYGPLYPLTITLVSKAFDQKDPAEQAVFATGTGFLVALGSAGAAFFPWFTGAMAQVAGETGVWVFLPISIGLNVLLLVLFVWMVAIVRKRNKEREGLK